MSKKQDHPLLRRLLTITEQRLPFAPQVEQLRRQRQWLIDLEHRLDCPAQAGPSRLAAEQVAQAVQAYLHDLARDVTQGQNERDQQVVAHLEKTLRNQWWGLFQCYAVEGIPRTNNDLERFSRLLKTGQRRITGRKNVHDFILRYGPAAACIDHEESLGDLLARLRRVSHDDFLQERRMLTLILLGEQKQHRFRHHRAGYLNDLEAQWSALARDGA